MKKSILPFILLILLGLSTETSAQKKKPAAVAGIIGDVGGDNTDKKNNGGNKEQKIISAEKVMERRGLVLNEIEKEILTAIYTETAKHRNWENQSL